MQSPRVQSTVNWQVYTKFVETKNLFIIYSSKLTFNIVPKRAFVSREDLAQFRELLLAQVVK
ncbi:MAG: YcxB family protein [Merismopedia sp. SIO2A8]|nr:YcxB family protein [Symploca sp. SIO2B6]NET50467.1 YcxB family protein [Merismopedia sp. SIO2A8]